MGVIAVVAAGKWGFCPLPRFGVLEERFGWSGSIRRRLRLFPVLNSVRPESSSLCHSATKARCCCHSGRQGNDLPKIPPADGDSPSPPVFQTVPSRSRQLASVRKDVAVWNCHAVREREGEVMRWVPMMATRRRSVSA